MRLNNNDYDRNLIIKTVSCSKWAQKTTIYYFPSRRCLCYTSLIRSARCHNKNVFSSELERYAKFQLYIYTC